MWESLLSWHLGQGCALPAEHDSAETVSDAELAARLHGRCGSA